MRALIIANGDLPDRRIIGEVLRSCRYVVCADGGARHAMRLGIRPDIILGDFDSLRDPIRRHFSSSGGRARRRVRILPVPDQESTDLEKAIRHCIGRGVRQATVVGATGARSDHSSLALGCFRKFGRRIELRIIDRAGTITMPARDTCIPLEEGEPFSLIPVGRCAGVRLENALYPLRDEALEPGVREGVSNRALGGPVRLRYRTGVLLLYRFHRKGHGGRVRGKRKRG